MKSCAYLKNEISLKNIQTGSFLFILWSDEEKKKVAERFIETIPHLKQFLIFINPEKKPKVQLYLRSAQRMSSVFSYWYLPNSSALEASNFVFAFLDQYGTFLKSIHAFAFHNFSITHSITVHCYCLLSVSPLSVLPFFHCFIQSFTICLNSSHLSGEKVLLINIYSWFYIIYIMQCLLWWK